MYISEMVIGFVLGIIFTIVLLIFWVYFATKKQKNKQKEFLEKFNNKKYNHYNKLKYCNYRKHSSKYYIISNNIIINY